MIEVLTSAEQRLAAKQQAEKMNYEGSMMQGQRDAHASLAEIVACEYVRGEMVRDYDHDFKAWWGLKVDVKNKVLSYPPKDHYDVSIFAYTEKQACDFLLFTGTPKDGSRVWICGGYGKAAFLRDAELKKAGEVVGTNNLTYKRDNYVMQIKDIMQADVVVKMLRGELQSTTPKTIEQKLAEINSLDILDGFANRSRVLGVQMQKWSQSEREAILRRKFELEHGVTRK